MYKFVDGTIVLTYHGSMAGDELEETCEKAVRFFTHAVEICGSQVSAGMPEDISDEGKQRYEAARHGRFKGIIEFDGVTVQWVPSMDVDRFTQHLINEIEADRKRYLQSDEYTQYQAKQAAETAACQEQVDKLMHGLDTVISEGDYKVVAWCGLFSHYADHIGVDYDPAPIMDKLEAAGYRASAYLGGLAYNRRDPKTRAPRLIGWMMDCIPRKMFPPILRSKCNEFATTTISHSS